MTHSRSERRVGAQLLAGLASYLQSVLSTDRRLSLNLYARLSKHENARICRRPGEMWCRTGALRGASVQSSQNATMP
jgi:hypothetical protein